MIVRRDSTAGSRRRFKAGAIVAAGLVLSSAACAAENYRVAAGDVIEFRVAGAPELSQRYTVQDDGSVVLPTSGNAQVAGLTLADVRAKLMLTLASRVLRQPGPDGREHIVAIQPKDVIVAIAEYRPVYVSGDVLNPGQHPYRPSMTARQLIALAGGPSILHSRVFGTGDPLELQTQYASLGVQLATGQIHAARIQAELAGKSEIDLPELADVPIERSTAAEVLRVEQESLRISLATHAHERDALVSQIEHADVQISVIKADQAQGDQALQVEQQDLERTVRAFGAGAMPSPRVLDSRRAVLGASARRLQMIASLAQLNATRDDLILRLDTLASERRVGLLAALNKARVDLIELRGRLISTRKRIGLAASTQDSEWANDGAGMEIGVVRKIGDAWEAYPARVDETLQPGDVITIRIRLADDITASGPETR